MSGCDKDTLDPLFGTGTPCDSFMLIWTYLDLICSRTTPQSPRNRQWTIEMGRAVEGVREASDDLGPSRWSTVVQLGVVSFVVQWRIPFRVM